MRLSVSLLCVFATLVATAAFAEAPRVMSFQGKLTDLNGVPKTGGFQMTFRLWDSQAGGNMLLEDFRDSVSVDNEGLYNVEMDVPAGISFESPLWLGVEVELDGEMAPRYRLTASPYSFWAMDAGMLEGNTIADLDLRYVNEGQVNSISSIMIIDGTIVNADIAGDANIDPLKIKGIAWTAENDGSGSGLDADLLDGYDSSDFLKTDSDYGRPGVSPDLYEGSTPLTDKYVNEGQPDAVTSEMIKDGEVKTDDISDEVILDKHINGSAEIIPSKIKGTAWTSLNDGPGSGLNADLLDDLDSGNDNGNVPVSNGILCTGLNADMVDGKHSDELSGVNGTPNYIAKFTAPNKVGNSIIFERRDKIGIGTTNPACELEVSGNLRITGKASIDEDCTNPGDHAFVAGLRNTSSGSYATVAGGRDNEATGLEAAVSGGRHNTASGFMSFIGGGAGNTASESLATICGGDDNEANGPWSTIGGGDINVTSGRHTSIGGGLNNKAAGYAATIPGGQSNNATGDNSVVGGGDHNTAKAGFATVCGGCSNQADSQYATVSGGTHNRAGYYSFIGGGSYNWAGDYNATIAGGWDNIASGYYSVVGGGAHDTSSGYNSTVAGGGGNVASGYISAICGGRRNLADGEYSFVGGGDHNKATGHRSTIAGGDTCAATSWYAAIGGGFRNLISGLAGVIPGGYADTVQADYSFAAGKRVRIRSGGNKTFAFGNDFETSTPSAAVFYDEDATFKLGVGVKNPTHNIDVAGGAYCNGTQWVDVSTRSAKKDIQALNDSEYLDILEKIAELEIVRYRYKTQEDEELHIGVIAEDAPEELVTPDRTGVPTGDAIGVLLAALKAQQKRIEALEAKLQTIESSR